MQIFKPMAFIKRIGFFLDKSHEAKNLQKDCLFLLYKYSDWDQVIGESQCPLFACKLRRNSSMKIN